MTIEEAIKYLEDKNEDGRFNEVIEILRQNVPLKVDVKEWIYTKCPKCSEILSTHHGDGYYSVERYDRCPSCNQKLQWELSSSAILDLNLLDGRGEIVTEYMDCPKCGGKAYSDCR